MKRQMNFMPISRELGIKNLVHKSCFHAIMKDSYFVGANLKTKFICSCTSVHAHLIPVFLFERRLYFSYKNWQRKLLEYKS